MTGVRDACCSGAGVVVGPGVSVEVGAGSSGAGVVVGAASEAIERTGVTVGFGSGVDVEMAAVEELQAIAASATTPNAVQMT